VSGNSWTILVLRPASNLQNTDRYYQSSFSTIQVSGVRSKNIGLSAEVYRNRKVRKSSCQLMTENDNSWSQEDDSWRKPTCHVEMVGRQAGFFAQSSVLNTHYLSTDPEHW